MYLIRDYVLTIRLFRIILDSSTRRIAKEEENILPSTFKYEDIQTLL